MNTSNMIAKQLRTSINRLAQVARAIATELHHLNSARMDSTKFASIPPRARPRIVKAALREHHSNPNRCC
jgi:hypothetical protein